MDDYASRLRHRREELEVELQKGQELIRNLQSQQEGAKITVLRIQGAIALLDELLTPEPLPKTE